MIPVPGSLVAWWDGNLLAFGVASGEEKQRVRLVLPGGREERVAASRVAFEIERGGPAPGKALDEMRQAGERAAACEARVRALAATVDVCTVWELVAGTDQPSDEADLAELALGARSGEKRAAVVLAILSDGVRFTRRASGWQPRPAQSVDEILAQRSRAAEKTAARHRVFETLAAACRGEPFALGETEEERRYVHALEELAIRDLDATDTARALAMEAMDFVGIRFDRPHEGAFSLLRLLGRFASDDENLAVVRYGLRTRFSQEVLNAASQACARGFERAGRTDLTGLEIVTVDGPRTREVDDGLSLEILPGTRWRLGVHIADPGAFVDPGSIVDVEALSRATTHYLPEMRLPMLPPSISEQAASLLAGEDRPGLSFLVVVDREGEIESFEVVRSVLRASARLDYDGADRAIGTGHGTFAALLRDLANAAAAREERRRAAGAVILHVPEVDVVVDADGRIVLDRTDPGSPAHRVVAEAMILAGTAAATFCLEAGLPVIYRRQGPPDRAFDAEASAPRDLAAARAVRMSLRRADTGIHAGPHRGLGVAAYVQVTSPLRRFQDLVAHRQIAAALGESPLPYDAAALQRIAATTERVEADGRRAERAAERYWLLRYLAGRRSEVVEGIVVETEPRSVVVLHESLLEEAVPSLSGVPIGAEVRLRIEKVNPRADLLVLRPV